MESWLDEFRYMQQERRMGRAHLHDASVCDRPRLSHARAGGLVEKLSAAGAVFMTMEDAAAEARAENVFFVGSSDIRSSVRWAKSLVRAVPTNEA